MQVRWRGVAAGLGCVALAVLASGCSGTPGAAAVVDGREIPTSDVYDATSELSDLFQGVTTPNVLAVLVQEPVFAEVAVENGVPVSDEAAEAVLVSAASRNGATPPESFSDASLAVARYLVANDSLQGLDNADEVAQDIDSRLRELDVTVNPRFGTLEEPASVVDPTPWPWIVPSS